MDVIPTSIPENRPLTAEELHLARWLLEHGEPGARAYLPHLEHARVVSRCPCGCASIDLQVDGFPPARGVGRILADFTFPDGDEIGGIFIYESNGGLGGMEVWGVTGDAPRKLPPPHALEPLVLSAGG